MQPHVVKCVSNLWKVDDFLQEFMFLSLLSNGTTSISRLTTINEFYI